MNKWKKEVLESLLESEKEVLEELAKHYKRALRDIEEKVKILLSDELTQSRVYRLEYQTALYNQVAGILEKLHSDEYTTISQFLKDSYNNGFVGTMYDLHGQGVPMLLAVDPKSAVQAVLTDSKLSEPLYKSLGIDIDKMKKRVSTEITRGIAAGMSNYEIARNLHNATKAPLSRALTIARTESHRIQETASFDAGKLAKSKGADLVKIWDAVLDGDTRETHRVLDGKIVEMDEPFVSGSNKAMYPGKFGDPAEDCNCRCTLDYIARSALDEEDLKEMQERAAFFGLDKTEDFEDFKKKYLKAAESIENSEKYGIIKTKKSVETSVKDERNTIVKDAIKNGIVSKEINPNKQNRHIRESGEYIEGRSYVYGTLEDAQKLVDALSGTGEPILDVKGRWTSKERVVSDSALGVFVDINTKTETETRAGTIIYSKTGSHIVPRKEQGK